MTLIPDNDYRHLYTGRECRVGYYVNPDENYAIDIRQGFATYDPETDFGGSPDIVFVPYVGSMSDKQLHPTYRAAMYQAIELIDAEMLACRNRMDTLATRHKELLHDAAIKRSVGEAPHG